MTTTNGGVDYKERVTTTPNRPSQFYPVLKPGGGPLAWSLPIGGSPPTFDTYSESGVSAWSLRMVGRVPGRLQVAWWTPALSVADDDPSRLDAIDLGPGSWDTGPLHVVTYDSSSGDPPEYNEMRARFVPINLLYLLP